MNNLFHGLLVVLLSFVPGVLVSWTIIQLTDCSLSLYMWSLGANFILMFVYLAYHISVTEHFDTV